jgi:glycosyltransferase involved in cell wall biosynthesis
MTYSSPTPKLSILIPSVPSRVTTKMLKLFNNLEEQVQKLPNPNDVEILVFLDNKKRSIGYKRESLLTIARGKYVAFADDDDLIENYYIEEAIKAIDSSDNVDVITFKERVFINKKGPYELTFQLGYSNNDEVTVPNAKRPPWHCCFWRRDLAQKFHYPDSMYGEDWAWASQANQEAKTSYHIDNFMRTYVYDDNVTEAI